MSARTNGVGRVDLGFKPTKRAVKRRAKAAKPFRREARDAR